MFSISLQTCQCHQQELVGHLSRWIRIKTGCLLLLWLYPHFPEFRRYKFWLNDRCRRWLSGWISQSWISNKSLHCDVWLVFSLEFAISNLVLSKFLKHLWLLDCLPVEKLAEIESWIFLVVAFEIYWTLIITIAFWGKFIHLLYASPFQWEKFPTHSCNSISQQSRFYLSYILQEEHCINSSLSREAQEYLFFPLPLSSLSNSLPLANITSPLYWFSRLMLRLSYHYMPCPARQPYFTDQWSYRNDSPFRFPVYELNYLEIVFFAVATFSVATESGFSNSWCLPQKRGLTRKE